MCIRDRIVKNVLKEGQGAEKTAKIYRGPSKRGPCRVCGKTGIRRYMIAADLPEPMHLCDGDYKMIREELRLCLRRILEQRGLLPKKIAEAEVGPYRVRIEKDGGRMQELVRHWSAVL